MSAWYVYILRCGDGSLYTGITNDLVRRLERHSAGTAAKYTRGRQPVILAWKRRMKSATLARKTEVVIKKLTRFQKIDLLSGKKVYFTKV